MVEKTADLKSQFLAWQCLVRQRAMRVGDGRPTSGMCPHLSLADGGSYSGQVTLLVIRTDAAHDVSQFRHMVQKTHDPADRYKAAIKYLSATYYQKPQEFSDEMTGLFGAESLLSRALSARGSCILEFSQFGSRYRLACSVRDLEEKTEAYQATYWHNRLFNPRMPAEIKILGFLPDWREAAFEEARSSD
tara:strand:+ start:1109 stop:1678 length:570 start_codon:yes stop_codon:yes gene_type:complete